MEESDFKNERQINNLKKSNNMINNENLKKEGNIKNEEYINNNINLLSAICYNNKINELKQLIKNKNNINSCNIHSLPLNIICIDERKKICSQCALNDIHSTHQIITDKDVIINIEKLIELLKEINNNQIKYLSNNNSINTKNIIENINLNINQSIELVNKTKQNIINNINKQCQKIINFLNKRKKEIEKKYQNNYFDMNNLRESALNWIQNANYKLEQINDINETNFDLIKLIDEENDQNISNLIRAGKQLKDRFIFAQESIIIIKHLDEFKNVGIKIEPNDKLINSICKLRNRNLEKNDEKDNKEEKNIANNENNNKNIDINEEIKITLFNIEENYNLINLLHLERSEFEVKEKSKINKNQSLRENSKNNEINKKPEKSLINIDDININDTLLISQHSTLYNNNNNTNSQSSKKLTKHIQNNHNKDNHITNLQKFENKNELNKNLNAKISNYIITKKIFGLNNLNNNKTKDSNIIIRNNSKNKINDENNSKINNVKNIKIKDNYIKSFYKMNSEETLYTSYSRSPMSRRNDYYQSIHFDKANLINSNNKRDQKIKVGLNNKMNNCLYKNKEKRNSSKVSYKKNSLSTKRNSILHSKKNSKEKDKLNTLNISFHNTKNLKLNNSKISLRNHRSKKSFNALYSERHIHDFNTNKFAKFAIRNEENNESLIKLDICNHYNNDDIENNEKNSNNFKKDILSYNIANTDKNNASITKSKKDLHNIVFTQMRSNTPNFSRINMHGIGIQLICNYLHKNGNKSYKEMKLLGCNLMDDDLFLLAKTLLDHNINIFILNLSNNRIGDESASSILDLVKEHRTLKGLSLYNNLISDLLKKKLKEYTELGRDNLPSIQLYI